MAEKAGLSLRTYQNIEYGVSLPTLAHLELLARAVGVHPSDLLFAKDANKLPEPVTLEVKPEQALKIMKAAIKELRRLQGKRQSPKDGSASALKAELVKAINASSLDASQLRGLLGGIRELEALAADDFAASENEEETG